jgi:hypothetical protein
VLKEIRQSTKRSSAQFFSLVQIRVKKTKTKMKCQGSRCDYEGEGRKAKGERHRRI